jgi:hypothetical protein
MVAPRRERRIEAYEAGDHARADTRFAAFGRAYANDAARADAAFLRAIGRQRRGDRAGADGLRSAEARPWLDAGLAP